MSQESGRATRNGGGRATGNGGRRAAPTALALLLVLAALLSACAGAKPGGAKKSGPGDRVTVSEAEAAGFTGKWTGPMETSKFTAQMELALPREGTELRAEGRFAMGDLKSAEPIRDFSISGQDITFKTGIGGANVHFTGRLDGDKLNGTLVAYQGANIVATGTWKLSKS